MTAPVLQTVRRKRRRPRFWVLLAAWVAALMILAYGKWVRERPAHLAIWRALRAAENATAPPTRVVFDGDTQDMAALFRTGEYHHWTIPDSTRDYGAYWSGMNDVLDTLNGRCASYAHFRADGQRNDWQGIGAPFRHDQEFDRRRLVPMPSPSTIVVYLHSRRAGGVIMLTELRLVAYGDSMGIYVVAQQIGGFFDDAPGYSLDILDPHLTRSWRGVDLSKLRIFAGQSDPTDASRFSIAYELDHVPGEIRGRLQPGGGCEIETTGPLGNVEPPPWIPTDAVGRELHGS